MHTTIPIVFFGTGPVAAASLERLHGSFTIEAVVTKPNPPHHKHAAPVIEVARQHGLPLLLAANKAELDTLIAAQRFTSRVAVLIDYGIIVSQAVIDTFPAGIVNSHFSLLPQWRGADPITFAILSGQAQTGVSLMLLVQKMDEGPLLARMTYDLPATITTPELTDTLVAISASLLRDSLPQYLAGDLTPQPQGTDGVSYSRKLSKTDGLLDAAKPAITLEREVRAFIGWPGSRLQLFGRDATVTRAHAAHYPPEPDHQPGDISVSDDRTCIILHTSDGQLIIERLKPAGKKEMDAADFLRGVRI